MRELLTVAYCEQNRTKKASKGYKTICPGCQGNDLWITLQNSTGYCWECGTSYKIVVSLSDDVPAYKPYVGKPFDTKAIREKYTEAANYYHSCVGKDQEEFLKLRGISQEAINFFHIGFCPNSSHPMYLDETAKEAGLADGKGHSWLADRIVFPYIADGGVTDLRGRTMIDEDPKYKSLYHRSERRGALYPFNYDVAMQTAAQTKKLIVTEGEIKAIIPDHTRFAIMALPGMLSYRPALVAQPDVSIVVVFDNSALEEDKVRIDRAIARFASRVAAFSVVTLPLLGQKKMDIDTFFLTGDMGKQQERFQYYIDNAVPYALYKRLRSF